MYGNYKTKIKSSEHKNALYDFIFRSGMVVVYRKIFEEFNISSEEITETYDRGMFSWSDVTRFSFHK